MRRFTLLRLEDESGVSGTGTVAEGCQFSNGLGALTWCRDLTSMTWGHSIEDLDAIHSHGGKTLVVWVDEPESD